VLEVVLLGALLIEEVSLFIERFSSSTDICERVEDLFELVLLLL